MTEVNISYSKWNKAIDRWLEEQTSKSGEERIVEWPPSMFALRGGLEEKIATPDQISSYAAAIGDPNPLWIDQNYARKTKWGGIIAPPTFENSIGTPFDFGEIYKLPGYLTVLDSGTSREYFTVIRPLDEFTATDIYVGVKEIPEVRKPYRRFLQQIERTYYNQRHEIVAVVLCNTTIIVDAPGNKYRFIRELYKGIKRPHYRREELDEIYREYDEELEGKWRRGAEPRYWEDVFEGQEIHSTLFGLRQDPDSLYIFKTGHTHSFAIKWAVVKQDLARAVIDPETGEYRTFIDRYFSDHVARLTGFPYAIGVAMQNETCISHAVTNWMGDDGFVTRLDTKHESINFLGESNRVKGKVTRKYIDGDQHLVDLDLWSECQDGRLLTKGLVTVQLISRGEESKGQTGGGERGKSRSQNRILTGGL